MIITTITLPPGWRQCYTKEGRVFYANDVTKHAQWEHPMYSIEEQEARDLSNAIKASLNNENAISEVSNNNTVNTISMDILNKPAANNNQQYISTIQLQPIAKNYIIPKPQSTPINDSSEIIQRKIYDKEHIIWLFAFCLGIYDLVTDYQCAIIWRKYSSLCTQFRCAATVFNVENMATAWSTWLLLCSTVGFIGCFVLKLQEFKMLYQIFKHPITKHELQQKEQINWKTFLYLGWISAVLEDTVSLYMVTVVWMNSNVFLSNITGFSLYTQSLVSSLLSICVTILLSCRKHWKLMQAALFQCARCCHCCWCIIICLLTLGPLYIILWFIMANADDVGEWPKIDIIYNWDREVHGNYYCPIYNNSEHDSIHMGELTGFPDLIYENCSGMDYEYNLFCLENGPDHIQLNCTLQWEYKYIIYNTSNSEYMNVSMWEKYDDFNCYNYDEDYCEFDIELGVCGHYPTSCKNQFEFYGNNSDPTMWACFDYCEY